jgi:septal ring factor EnvC (AmiA/AmiB activator)
MIKKAFWVGAGAVFLLSLLFGRDAMSYVSTGYSRVRAVANDSVPLEFQLDRARQMIKDLDKPIQNSMHLIAKEEVEVAKLVRQVERNDKELATAKNEIMRLNGDLERGGSNYVYAGHTYSEKQVKDDLARRFERFQVSEQTTAKLRQILAAREKGLSAAREKLTAMEAAKRQLEVDVENLVAREKMIEVAKASSEINIDDSALARTRELIGDIGSRLDVAERLVNTDTQLHGEINLDEPEVSDITEKVTKYFGGESKTSDNTLVKASK